MENTKRVTKTQRFEDIIAMLNGESVTHGTTIKDAIDTLTHEMELLAKKNSAVDKRKLERQAKDNVIKVAIVAFLANKTKEQGVQCTKLNKLVSECEGLSTSKLSTLCNALVAEGRISKDTVKGATVFYGA